MTFAWPFMLLGARDRADRAAARPARTSPAPARYAVAFTNVNAPSLGRAAHDRRGAATCRSRCCSPRSPRSIVGLARPAARRLRRPQAGDGDARHGHLGLDGCDDVPPTRLRRGDGRGDDVRGRAALVVQGGLVPFATTASVAVAPTSDRAQVKTALARLRARRRHGDRRRDHARARDRAACRRGRRPAPAGGLEGHRARDPAALRRRQLRGHRPARPRRHRPRPRASRCTRSPSAPPTASISSRSLRPDLPRAAGPGHAQGRRADDRRRVLHGRRRRDAAPRVREHRHDRRRYHEHQDVSYASPASAPPAHGCRSPLDAVEEPPCLAATISGTGGTRRCHILHTTSSAGRSCCSACSCCRSC